MLNRRAHRRIILVTRLFIALTVLLFFGCDSRKNEDPKKVAEHTNDAKFDSEDQKQDAAFITDAASMCLYEIKLSKLAEQNSIRADVQEKGKVLEAAYSRVFKSIMELASAKSITLPADMSDAQKKTYNDLSFEISKDFDKKYVDIVTKDHTNTIGAYKKEAAESKDSAIKDFVQKTLPILQDNLQLVSSTYKP